MLQETYELKLDLSNQDEETTTKWIWMMNWCKTKRYAPANPHFWKKAEEAYNNDNNN